MAPLHLSNGTPTQHSKSSSSRRPTWWITRKTSTTMMSLPSPKPLRSARKRSIWAAANTRTSGYKSLNNRATQVALFQIETNVIHCQTKNGWRRDKCAALRISPESNDRRQLEDYGSAPRRVHPPSGRKHRHERSLRLDDQPYPDEKRVYHLLPAGEQEENERT